MAREYQRLPAGSRPRRPAAAAVGSELFRHYVDALAKSPRDWFRLRDCDALARFTMASALACNDLDDVYLADAEWEILAELGDTLYDAVAFYKHQAEGETNSTFGYVGGDARVESFRRCRELLWPWTWPGPRTTRAPVHPQLRALLRRAHPHDDAPATASSRRASPSAARPRTASSPRRAATSSCGTASTRRPSLPSSRRSRSRSSSSSSSSSSSLPMPPRAPLTPTRSGATLRLWAAVTSSCSTAWPRCWRTPTRTAAAAAASGHRTAPRRPAASGGVELCAGCRQEWLALHGLAA